MASLHKLLSDEGFNRQKPSKSVKFKDRRVQQDSIALPIFICRDRRSLDSSRKKLDKAFSLKGSRRAQSDILKVESSKPESTPGRDEPAIDDVAIKAMISILTGYVGRYLRDGNFREKIKEKCSSCLVKRRKHSNNEIFAHMEMGIRSIEKLVENQLMDLESLQKSIKFFNILASADSRNESPDSSLSACAQLYLSIVYKFAKNDRISARHLLQVFGDSPFLARTHLLPELWEHFFLPHLLHIKIWYTKEIEFLSVSDYVHKEKKTKELNEQYNHLMDTGTVQFSLYYKEWLTIGGQSPSLPSLPLPSRPSYVRSRRRSSDSSSPYHAISNKSLYQAVFGSYPKGKSMDMDKDYKIMENTWGSESEAQENVSREKAGVNPHSHVEVKKASAHRRSSSHIQRTEKANSWHETKKKENFRFLTCIAKPPEFLELESYEPDDDKIHVLQLNDMNRAIATICSSESLNDCEMAIRALSEDWLNSQGGLVIETSLSLIQGILEVLFVSNNDEVLELAISILAELAAKSEINREYILNADPQLDVSMRLLRSSNLFLKAATLLYLVKPKAEKMVAKDWIPLVLRVLEYGDQSQTLFNVTCSPYEAAHYFLDQILTGFDEGKNLENARQIISLGGLRVLVRRMEVGNTCERSKAVSILQYCIRADGSCRHYLAVNLKKENIISLLLLEKKIYAQRQALALLIELLCISRTKQRTEILRELTKGWECLDTMQILLFHIQRARPEERPIIAIILLQLDLMGDTREFSVYREEAIDVIVKALDCSFLNEKIQDRSARALLLLAGHFSYTGEPDIEKWLLRKAGLYKYKENSFNGKSGNTNGYQHLNEEDENSDNWQRKVAEILLTSGNTRLLAALMDSLANGIPCLARASLVTICWMSNTLNSLGDKDLQFAACSIVVPQLVECLQSNRSLEERVLASFSLFGVTKGTDYLSNQSQMEKEIQSCLYTLSQVTWTAKELILLMRSS